LKGRCMVGKEKRRSYGRASQKSLHPAPLRPSPHGSEEKLAKETTPQSLKGTHKGVVRTEGHGGQKENFHRRRGINEKKGEDLEIPNVNCVATGYY